MFFIHHTLKFKYQPDRLKVKDLSVCWDCNYATDVTIRNLSANYDVLRALGVKFYCNNNNNTVEFVCIINLLNEQPSSQQHKQHDVHSQTTKDDTQVTHKTNTRFT